MTCGICKYYDICILRNSLESCTHDDPEHVKSWALGLPEEHSQNKEGQKVQKH